MCIYKYRELEGGYEKCRRLNCKPGFVDRNPVCVNSFKIKLFCSQLEGRSKS